MSMRLGEKAELYISGNLGYGINGFPSWSIPPNADLIFDIELLSIGEEINLPTQAELAKAVCNYYIYMAWNWRNAISA
jgi:hypothetical protein